LKSLPTLSDFFWNVQQLARTFFKKSGNWVVLFPKSSASERGMMSLADSEDGG
jgi:hypothetical protein